MPRRRRPVREVLPPSSRPGSAGRSKSIGSVPGDGTGRPWVSDVDLPRCCRVAMADGIDEVTELVDQPGGPGAADYRAIEFGGGSFAVVAALTLAFLALFF